MKVGLIVEGRSDAAVITNILKGKLMIQKSDIQYLVPEFDYDETSLSQMRKENFSNWTIVRDNCQNREKIANFLDTFDDERFLIIHIDSDMRAEKGFDVKEPIKLNDKSDIDTLHQNIVYKISEWLSGEHLEKISFAIAISEIDSWVLSLFSNRETGLGINDKERLFREVNSPNKFSKSDKQKIFGLEKNKFEQYSLLSKDFIKPKRLAQAQEYNRSLKLFCEDLERFNGD